jgi:hypothetical protein
VSTLLHAIVCFLHALLNVLVQVANKMGLQNIYIYTHIYVRYKVKTKLSLCLIRHKTYGKVEA